MKVFGRQFLSKTGKAKLCLVITSVTHSAHDLSGPSKPEAEMSEVTDFFFTWPKV